MQKLLLFILLFLAAGCEHADQKDKYIMHDDFYYIEDGRFYLEEIANEYFVIVKQDRQEYVIDQLLQKGFKLIGQPYAWNVPNMANHGSLDEISDCVVFTIKGDQNIASITDIVYSNNLYLTSAGDKVGSSIESNTFMVKLSKEDKDGQIERLRTLAIQHGYLLIGEMSRDYFKLACTNRTAGNNVEMSNWFIEVAGFDTAQPILSQPDIAF